MVHILPKIESHCCAICHYPSCLPPSPTALFHGMVISLWLLTSPHLNWDFSGILYCFIFFLLKLLFFWLLKNHSYLFFCLSGHSLLVSFWSYYSSVSRIHIDTSKRFFLASFYFDHFLHLTSVNLSAPNVSNTIYIIMTKSKLGSQISLLNSTPVSPSVSWESSAGWPS